ncbi:MAG TPA: glucosidase [Actinomycetota bacterium]|nr:glucosidase [Actinomycetota bacterium]
MANPERARLKQAADKKVPWKRWGPYLAERAWGTVREDYSPDGDAWGHFPHEHSRSRAYRWSEDGLAGICDTHQILCFAIALWNRRDPILKERIFGLTNPQGNHGEDPKEHWFYVDSTPTHSYMRWTYFYPQSEFPYEGLVEENRRSRNDPEFELEETGAFESGYFQVTVEYAKSSPEDICILISVRNGGSDDAGIDVLPTLWFRNTWSWGLDARKPSIRLEGDGVVAEHHSLGKRTLFAGDEPQPLFCDNETNAAKLWGSTPSPKYPKDGINDHVVSGAATVNPALTGTKAAVRYRLEVPAGETVELRLRLTDQETGDLEEEFDETFADRRFETNEFYEELAPTQANEDEVRVMRQAFAGMLWTKQFYHYDVERWLKGDPAGPAPAESRRSGRNVGWSHLDNYDVISMPDKWEYPWYAAWDLAFHAVALAHVDADFAKDQLLLMLREWYQHPNGQIPAYEWNFSDVNPPVHAWACLKVFEIDGSRDFVFLGKTFQKLLMNFTWWINRKDRDGNNVFEGGFLGLDNIGPIDRSATIQGGYLEQSDGTSWMAMYALNLLQMAMTLADKDPVYEDITTKFFEHFCYIAAGINSVGLTHGLWDEAEGFYYDILHKENGDSVPLRVRSMVGLIVLFAVLVLEEKNVRRLPDFVDRELWFLSDKLSILDVIPHIDRTGERGERILSIVGPERLRRILEKMFDESEFLSPFGIRALSRVHKDQPLEVDLGGVFARVEYEPAESSSGMFGGNSNWRGPIWFPVDYLLIDSLLVFHTFLGEGFKVEYPTGSGNQVTLFDAARDISRRLVSIFLVREDGSRPVHGTSKLFKNDPAWRELILFYEYFNGDNGDGLGASHQTGWTGLVADLIVTGVGLSTPRKGSRTRKSKTK